MKPASRYGLVGIGALGTLSLVHWARKARYDGPDMANYLIGVLPNVAAAIAIPFVLLSIWADQKPDSGFAAARHVWMRLMVAAGIVLIGWELIQQSSRALVFDPHDIGATVIGLALGHVLFLALAPRREARER